MTLLDVSALTAGYGSIVAIREIDLQVDAGEIVALIGVNGAGKSTLLKALAGLITPFAGRVVFNGIDTTAFAAEKKVGLGLNLVPERRELFNAMSVDDNLILGGYVRSRRGARDAGVDRELVRRLFPALEDASAKRAGSLSGGQQQQLAIARALMNRPKLLLLDEPSFGLSPIVTQQVFRTLRELRHDGMGILLVEQNARIALEACDRGYLVGSGCIVLHGSAAELCANEEVQRIYLGGKRKE